MHWQHTSCGVDMVMQVLLLLLPSKLHTTLGQRQRNADEGEGGAATERRQSGTL